MNWNPPPTLTLTIMVYNRATTEVQRVGRSRVSDLIGISSVAVYLPCGGPTDNCVPAYINYSSASFPHCRIKGAKLRGEIWCLLSGCPTRRCISMKHLGESASQAWSFRRAFLWYREGSTNFDLEVSGTSVESKMSWSEPKRKQWR